MKQNKVRMSFWAKWRWVGNSQVGEKEQIFRKQTLAWPPRNNGTKGTLVGQIFA